MEVKYPSVNTCQVNSVRKASECNTRGSSILSDLKHLNPLCETTAAKFTLLIID